MKAILTYLWNAGHDEPLGFSLAVVGLAMLACVILVWRHEKQKVQKISDYTVQSSDNGKVIFFNSRAPAKINLPSMDSLPNGFNVIIKNQGKGPLTIEGPETGFVVPPRRRRHPSRFVSVILDGDTWRKIP